MTREALPPGADRDKLEHSEVVGPILEIPLMETADDELEVNMETKPERWWWFLVTDLV